MLYRQKQSRFEEILIWWRFVLQHIPLDTVISSIFRILHHQIVGKCVSVQASTVLLYDLEAFE